MSNEKELVHQKTHVVPKAVELFYLGAIEAQEGDEISVFVHRPKKKKLDWSKMPVDTLVVASNGIGRELRHYEQFNGGKHSCYTGGANSLTEPNLLASWDRCELAPKDKQPWHVWFGGECPLPDGVVVEYVCRGWPNEITAQKIVTDLYWSHDEAKTDIIAYRIVGLADGWEY